MGHSLSGQANSLGSRALTANYPALSAYLKEVSNRGFMWHVHDCFMFTNEAFRRLYGSGWADEWAGRYISELGLYKDRKELVHTFGYTSLEDAIDSKLERINYTPPRGALVTSKAPQIWAIDRALGISLGSKAAFLGKSRLVYIPIQRIENAWVKK